MQQDGGWGWHIHDKPSDVPTRLLAPVCHATLAVERVAGASSLITAHASDPLKLLAVRPRDPHATWVVLSTYGGGLVAGDELDLSVTVGADAGLWIGTQASTKVYRSDDGRAARQQVHLRVDAGGLCAWLPDPVVPFAGSRLDQRLVVDLDPQGSLVLLDAVVAGRVARGEWWDATDYRSQVFIDRAGRPWYRDALRWGAAGIDGAGRAPGVVATLVLAGPALAPLASRLADEVAQAGAAPWDGGVLVGAAARQDGLLLRLAAPAWPVAERWLYHRLSPLAARLGGAPWSHRV